MKPRLIQARRGSAAIRIGLAALLLCTAVSSPATTEPLAQSTITHDGSLGSGPIAQIPIGAGLLFEIGESNGHRPGGPAGINLLHSFGRFELAEADAARFGADSNLITENIVVRVLESPTRIEGRLDSSVPGAHLYWLSPKGVLFGENARLNVPGSLSVSTADSLGFATEGQDQVFEAHSGGAIPTLALARPEAFGFLGDASQRIVFDSSVICGAGYFFCGGAQLTGDLSLQAGGVDFRGGTAALLNSAAIEVIATDSIEISGFDYDGLGSILFVTNGDTPDGGSITLSADRIHLSDATTLIVDNHGGSQTTRGGEINLAATSLIRLDGTDSSNEPLGPLTADPAEEFGSTLFQAIRRTLQKGSVDILTVGSQADATGTAGAITLEAPVIELLDGAEVTTYALGTESADITLIATDRLELSGRGGDAAGSGSAVQSRNQGAGEAGARAGDVIVRAGDVLLRDGASLAVDTGGQGNAGNIDLEAGSLTLKSGSGLHSSSTASRADLQYQGDGAVPGQAGRIDVRADSVRLSGASAVDVFAAEGPDAGDLAPGEPSPPGLSEGNISIAAQDLLLLQGGSTIEASVGSGLGGSIAIGTAESPTTAVVLKQGSSILAQARGGIDPNPEASTRGGDIAITAETVLQCPGCLINADGPTSGSEGSVVINNPETNLDTPVAPPAVDYLDASSLLLAACGAEQSGAEAAGRLAVARWPGRSFSPGGPLLALAPLGMGMPPTDSLNDAPSSPAPESAFALALNRADLALRGGYTQQAGTEFQTLERDASRNSNASERGDALRGLGESRQAAGRYADSHAPLDAAVALARAAGDTAREAAALGALGNAYAAQGEFERAERALSQAVALAIAHPPSPTDSQRGLAASLLNNLGSERSLAGKDQEALAAYADSSAAASQANDWLGVAQAEANAAQAALALTRPKTAEPSLQTARAALAESIARGVSTGAEATAVRIHLAHSEVELARQNPQLRRAALLRAHDDLIQAARSAETSADLRAASYALGNLGRLYAEEGGRDKEALYLTRRALQSAEEARAADLLARWNAQAGQIEWRAGQVDAALDAYRRAVALLAEARPEAGAARGNADLAFRQAVEPIYLELVDLLLQRSNQADPADTQALLVEARGVIEDWKAAELRNYFRDGCAAELEATARSVEEIDPNAAVIYPILLPDRIEILVGRAQGISRHTVPVDRSAVESEARRFLGLLSKRTTHEYRIPARQLHAWLVAPYEAGLATAGIDTLVFVPSGVLRTIPMAALHDGDQFLLERYAVAITPSMNLLAPKAIAPGERNLLLAGLSQAVQGYPALPEVPGELASIEEIYGGEILLDSAFEPESLERALTNLQPGVVHIASHAEFTGEPDTSFVLTHSGNLGIEELSTLVRASRYGGQPVELLMLSACQTAAGDERAALGLAGVAIRAGARSAMGSLWSVSDQATAALVVDFYRALDQPGMTKARALQSAQGQLLADARFGHPFYWAPFLVINNWL
ncbi:MAG: CHAT domain-containing protein [Myxococcota bacterium]|nr:CHAT domain-containing protein [Myxococcota bacterium]